MAVLPTNEPIPPPKAKSGRVKRSAVQISKAQQALLDKDDAWFETIRANGKAAEFVPAYVLKDAQRDGSSEAPQKATPQKATPAQTPPTVPTPDKPASPPKPSTQPSPLSLTQRTTNFAASVAKSITSLSQRPPASRGSENAIPSPKPLAELPLTTQPAIQPQPQPPLSTQGSPARPPLQSQRVVSLSPVASDPPHPIQPSTPTRASNTQQPSPYFSPDWAEASESEHEGCESQVEVEETPHPARSTDKPLSPARRSPAPQVTPRESRVTPAIQTSSPREELEIQEPVALGASQPRLPPILPRQKISQNLADEQTHRSTEQGQLTSRSLSESVAMAVVVTEVPSPSGVIPSTFDDSDDAAKQALLQSRPMQPRRHLMMQPVFPDLDRLRTAAPPPGAGIDTNSKRFPHPRVDTPNSAVQDELTSDIDLRTPSSSQRSRSFSIHADVNRAGYFDFLGGMQGSDPHSILHTVEHSVSKSSEPASDFRGSVASMARSHRPCQQLQTKTHTASPGAWQLPYDAFKSAYPDYAGDLDDFVRACFCIQGFAKNDSLASFLYDDVIRAYLEFITYIQSDSSGHPLNLLKWYNSNVEVMEYTKGKVTKHNLSDILAIYPDNVFAIIQIANSQEDQPQEILAEGHSVLAVQAVQADQVKQVDQARQTEIPGEADNLDIGSSHAAPNSLMERVVRNELSPPSNPLAHPENSNSTGESSWQHGQLSSQPNAFVEQGLVGESQSQSQSQGRSNHQVSGSSSGDVELRLPSSAPATANIPTAFRHNKIQYMLRSPEKNESEVQVSSGRVPVDTPMRMTTTAAVTGGHNPTVAPPPGVPSNNRKRIREEETTQAGHTHKRYTAVATTFGGGSTKQVLSETGHQRLQTRSKFPAAPPRRGLPSPFINDGGGEDSDNFDDSILSVQSAEETRPPLVRPQEIRDERRRVTVGTTERRVTPPPPAPATARMTKADKLTSTATTAGAAKPKSKGRKKMNNGESRRRRFAEFLAQCKDLPPKIKLEEIE